MIIILIVIIAVAPDEMAYYVDLQLFLGGEIATIPQHYDGNIMMSDLLLIDSVQAMSGIGSWALFLRRF